MLLLESRVLISNSDMHLAGKWIQKEKKIFFIRAVEACFRAL